MRKEPDQVFEDVPSLPVRKLPSRKKVTKVDKVILSREELYSKSLVIELAEDKGLLHVKVSSANRPPSNVSSVQGDHVSPYANFIEQVRQAVDSKNHIDAFEGALLLISALSDSAKQQRICELALEMVKINTTASLKEGIKYSGDKKSIEEGIKFLVKSYLTQRNKEYGTAYFSINHKKREISKDSFKKLVILNSKKDLSKISELVDIMEDQLDYQVVEPVSAHQKETYLVKGRKLKKIDWRDNSIDTFALALSSEIATVLVFCGSFIPELHDITRQFTRRILTKSNSSWLNEFKLQLEEDTEESIIACATQKVFDSLPDWLKIELEEISSTETSVEENFSSMEVSSSYGSETESEDIAAESAFFRLAADTALVAADCRCINEFSTDDLLDELKKRIQEKSSDESERNTMLNKISLFRSYLSNKDISADDESNQAIRP